MVKEGAGVCIMLTENVIGWKCVVFKHNFSETVLSGLIAPSFYWLTHKRQIEESMIKTEEAEEETPNLKCVSRSVNVSSYKSHNAVR